MGLVYFLKYADNLKKELEDMRKKCRNQVPLKRLRYVKPLTYELTSSEELDVEDKPAETTMSLKIQKSITSLHSIP